MYSDPDVPFSEKHTLSDVVAGSAAAAAAPRARPWTRAAAGTWALRCILTLAAIAVVKRLAAAPPTPGAPRIHWEACPTGYPPSLECGRLEVPVDHKCSRADAQKISLGIVRLRANASEPLGNLVLNPGGPGSSIVGLFLAGKQEEVVGPRLASHYNIIAPDPRGVGVSNPVQCEAGIYNRRVSQYISSQADFDKLVSRNRALGESCAQMTGPVLNHLDTISAAKDLDYIREALGDSKLNFMGFSYGTQLGSQYAELFPDKVGKMVLDGILDHSQNQVDGLMTEVVAYENSINGFFSWCNTTSDCAFHHQDLPSIFDKMVDDANKAPIPAPGCRGPHDVIEPGFPACRSDVTGYELIASAQGPVSERNRWAPLSEALLEARRGNATQLSAPLASTDASAGEHFRPYSHTAISCQDWQREAGPRAGTNLLARLMAARALAPHTRGVCEMLDIQASCVGWPAPVTNPPRPLSRRRLAAAPPILLVNAFRDPSTSVSWAVALRAQMPTAVNVFRDGFGHTSYWDYGDTQKAIDSFFIEGTMPTDLAVFKT